MKKRCLNRRNKEFSVKQIKYILNEIKLIRNDLNDIKAIFENSQEDLVTIKPSFDILENAMLIEKQFINNFDGAVQ